jgi:hypothetical protein
MDLDVAGVVSPEVIYPPASQEELDETGQLVVAQKRRFILSKLIPETSRP